MCPLHSRHIKLAMQVPAETLLKTLEPLIKLSVSANSANSPGFCSIHTHSIDGQLVLFFGKNKNKVLSHHCHSLALSPLTLHSCKDQVIPSYVS